MKLTIAAVTALTLSAASAAQDAAPSPPPPPAPPACTTDAAPYRDFDFWVGEWEVFNSAGQKIGDNVVSKREGGCLILEEWTSAQGGTGTSMNIYDPLAGAWRQVWQSAWGFIDYAGGLDADGAMALEGEIYTHANGQTQPFRGKWSVQDDGSVLQEFWQPDAEGEWALTFAGEYRKKADADAG